VRQRVLAHYLGTSVGADVLAAAFRMGNITQNLLGEGTLSASFIPVYARLRARGQSDDARRFALACLGFLLAVVVVTSLLGVVLAPWLTVVLAAGFDADKQAATVPVVRIAFPMTGLLVLCAWALGVLNAHRRFFLPYAAPVVWNVFQIAALVLAGSLLQVGEGALTQAVAWGAFAGAGAQLLLLMPAARRLLGGVAPSLDTRAPGVREAVARLPGALVGRGVIQLSGLVDTLLVTFLGAGANATFAYAQTLYLLPMSLLGTGEAAAALPELAADSADANAERRKAQMRDRVGRSIGRVATLALPSTTLFWFLGGELITLLLRTGSFGAESTALVKPVIATYGAALAANATSRVLTTTCYALGDTARPARYAILRVVGSTAGSLVFMQHYGVTGVVMGAVLAAWLELALLGRSVARAIGGLGLDRVRWVRIVALTAACTVVGVSTRLALGPERAVTTLSSFVILMAFGFTFTVGSQLLGLFDVRSLLRRR
jgi:putative peptidoglycan lipid II flippase